MRKRYKCVQLIKNRIIVHKADSGDRADFAVRKDYSQVAVAAGFGSGTADIDCNSAGRPVDPVGDRRDTAAKIVQLDTY